MHHHSKRAFFPHLFYSRRLTQIAIQLPTMTKVGCYVCATEQRFLNNGMPRQQVSCSIPDDCVLCLYSLRQLLIATCYVKSHSCGSHSAKRLAMSFCNVRLPFKMDSLFGAVTTPSCALELGPLGPPFLSRTYSFNSEG